MSNSNYSPRHVKRFHMPVLSAEQICYLIGIFLMTAAFVAAFILSE